MTTEERVERSAHTSLHETSLEMDEEKQVSNRSSRTLINVLYSVLILRGRDRRS